MRTVGWALCFGLAQGLLTGCGGGGGDGGSSTTAPVRGFVTIDHPTAGETTTNCEQIAFSGHAFISPTHFSCCTGSASDTGVTVRWRNETSSQAGSAIQRVNESFGFPLDHTWFAVVPLIVGANVVTISASDAAGVQGSASVTVVKPSPSFTVSGTVRTPASAVVGSDAAAITFQLTGDATATTGAQSSSLTPTYSFACLANGNYVVTPQASGLAFAFTPASRNVTVGSANVQNVDFEIAASLVSGAVTFSSNGAGVGGAAVSLAGSPGSFTTFTSQSGQYRIAAPNGSFTITPSAPPLTFTPPDRSVLVNNADVPGVDFVSP